MKPSCILLVLAVGLSSCAISREPVAPAHQIPAERIRLADTIHLAASGWPQTRWWTVYDDAQLDALMDYALAHAPRIEAARTRVEQARSQVDTAASVRLPQATFFGAINRTRISGSGYLQLFSQNIQYPPLLSISGPWYTEGIVGVGGLYRIDLWGEDRARIAAAIGVRNARLAETSAVELDLSAAVAQLYFSIQTLSASIDLLQQADAIQSEVVADHDARFGRGLESKVPAAMADAMLLDLREQLTDERAQRDRLRETLRALIGAGADDMPPIDPTSLPAADRFGVPRTLEFDLLARRPDLQAMRWYVQASLSEVDVARAAFYPSFDIKAFFGLDSIQLGDLWKRQSRQYNLIPGLSLPLFDGGRLTANLKGARAVSNERIVQYNQAVLDALRDVAVSGMQLEARRSQVQQQQARVRDATIEYDSVQSRFQRGLASRTQAQQARLPVIALQIELVALRGMAARDSVSLTKALGGGYIENGDASR